MWSKSKILSFITKLISLVLISLSISFVNPVTANYKISENQQQSAVLSSLSELTPATIGQVSDSLGNIQTNSWTEDWADFWSCSPNCADLDLEVGDIITITTIATDPNSLPLEYKFSYVRSNGGVYLAQDWSFNNIFEWHVSIEDVGQGTGLLVNVRNNDGQSWQGEENGDDYTKLSYTVTNPNASPAILTRVTDSLGNLQTNSWTDDGSGLWSCWSSPSGCRDLNLEVGEIITITATASDPNGLPLEYKFYHIRNGSNYLAQDWSAQNIFEWHVSIDDIGGPSNNGILVAVRNNDGQDWHFDAVGDDYTYLFYSVNYPDLSPAIITKVTDSLGNITTDSISKGTGTGWSCYPYCPSLDLYVSQAVSFTVSALDPESLPLEYKFDLVRNGFTTTVQDWSSINTYYWSVVFEDMGPSNGLLIHVRNNDGIDWYGEFGGDDTATAMYSVYYSLIDQLEPSYADEGSPQIILTINGENFDSNSEVLFDGQILDTNFIDTTTLQAEVPGEYLQYSGAYPVQIINPNPDSSAAGSSFSGADNISRIFTPPQNSLFSTCTNSFSSDVEILISDTNLIDPQFEIVETNASSNISFFIVGNGQLFLPIIMK